MSALYAKWAQTGPEFQRHIVRLERFGGLAELVETQTCRRPHTHTTALAMECRREYMEYTREGVDRGCSLRRNPHLNYK